MAKGTEVRQHGRECGAQSRRQRNTWGKTSLKYNCYLGGIIHDSLIIHEAISSDEVL